eukprot:scaffold118_cov185-Amphora_coffeaeformis.AAC.5
MIKFERQIVATASHDACESIGRWSIGGCATFCKHAQLFGEDHLFGRSQWREKYNFIGSKIRKHHSLSHHQESATMACMTDDGRFHSDGDTDYYHVV